MSSRERQLIEIGSIEAYYAEGQLNRNKDNLLETLQNKNDELKNNSEALIKIEEWIKRINKTHNKLIDAIDDFQIIRKECENYFSKIEEHPYLIEVNQKDIKKILSILIKNDVLKIVKLTTILGDSFNEIEIEKILKQ